MAHYKRTIIRQAARAVFVFAAVTLYAEIALGFPENSRHGYTACSSCHVSPTGGGALTAYGRMTSAELSTWRGPKTQAVLGIFEPPEVLAVGGDQRTVVGSFPSGPGTNAYRRIPMQYDLELALHVTESVTVAATWGVYGPNYEEASRRHYALLRLSDWGTVRVGRFLPAYGLMGPDHTTYSRKALGFGEGTESVNAEFALHSKLGDLFVTSVYGTEATFKAEGTRDYDTDSETETGATVRLQAYPLKQTVGVSCLTMGSYEATRRACGAHLNVYANKWLFGTAQADYVLSTAETVTTSTLGVEAFRGVSVIYSHELSTYRYRNGLSLQWLPLPHLEIVATLKRETRAGGDADSWLLLVHHYL